MHKDIPWQFSKQNSQRKSLAVNLCFFFWNGLWDFYEHHNIYLAIFVSVIPNVGLRFILGTFMGIQVAICCLHSSVVEKVYGEYHNSCAYMFWSIWVSY